MCAHVFVCYVLCSVCVCFVMCVCTCVCVCVNVCWGEGGWSDVRSCMCTGMHAYMLNAKHTKCEKGEAEKKRF